MVSDGVDVIFNIQADAVHDFWGSGGGIPSDRARAQLAYDVQARSILLTVLRNEKKNQ
jgi:hypothetical protein